jgi:Nickel responsive protein SCO4226-like
VSRETVHTVIAVRVSVVSVTVNDSEGDEMNQYAIVRRRGWKSAGDLQEAAARSTRVGDEQMPQDIRWIRSYVLDEDSGEVGTVCIYEASSPDAIREHARRAELPVDEIIPIADTVIVREDPS